jgi:hypothetical protein
MEIFKGKVKKLKQKVKMTQQMGGTNTDIVKNMKNLKRKQMCHSLSKEMRRWNLAAKLNLMSNCGEIDVVCSFFTKQLQKKKGLEGIIAKMSEK